MQTWQNYQNLPSAPPPRQFTHGNGAVYLKGTGAPLGALTASGLGPWAESGASVLGSAFGGALIGLVAAHDKDGAYKGATFAGGLGAITEGFALYRQTNRVGGATLMALGLASMYFSLRSFMHHGRR